jgi:hypothetical protein
MWFPTAYLHDNVRFTPVDDNTVQVTFTDHGKSVSATLYIDDEGKLTNFVADRYYGGTNTLYPWHTPMTEYGNLGGLQVPARGKGVWQLPAGEFDYIDPVITQLEYNIGKRF